MLCFTKIAKGERNDKTEERSFSDFGTAEPHPILYKDRKTLPNTNTFIRNNAIHPVFMKMKNMFTQPLIRTIKTVFLIKKQKNLW